MLIIPQQSCLKKNTASAESRAPDHVSNKKPSCSADSDLTKQWGQPQEMPLHHVKTGL